MCTPLLILHTYLGTPWPPLSHRLQEPHQCREAWLSGATCTSQLESRCAEQAPTLRPQTPDGHPGSSTHWEPELASRLGGLQPQSQQEASGEEFAQQLPALASSLRVFQKAE